MASIGPIQRKPWDGNIETLKGYVDELERALRHFAANVGKENIQDGAITMNKLADDVKEKISQA